jgi:hypothetical protein
MKTFSFALFILCTAHWSIQSPVGPDRKGKKALASGATSQVKTTVSYKTTPQARGVLSQIDAHPTIKTFSSLSRSGGTKSYNKNRDQFFQKDHILLEAAKAKTAEEYVAHFDKLRPAAWDQILDANARKGINNSVSFLMNSHMRYLNKAENFKRLAKGGIARLCSTTGFTNRLKRKKGDSEVPPGEYSGKKRLLETQARNANAFRNDMIKAGIELGDDPVKFEYDSRVLINGQGKKSSTWKLKDFLAKEGKDQSFIDQVRNLRLYHNNEGRQKKRKVGQKGQQSEVSLSSEVSHNAADRKGKKSIGHSQASVTRVHLNEGIAALPLGTLATNTHKDHEEHRRPGQDDLAPIGPSSRVHHDRVEQSGTQSAHKVSSSTNNDDVMDDAAFWKAMLSN